MIRWLIVRTTSTESKDGSKRRPYIYIEWQIDLKICWCFSCWRTGEPATTQNISLPQIGLPLTCGGSCHRGCATNCCFGYPPTFCSLSRCGTRTVPSPQPSSLCLRRRAGSTLTRWRSAWASTVHDHLRVQNRSTSGTASSRCQTSSVDLPWGWGWRTRKA